MRFLFFILFPVILFGYTKNGNIYTTDGSVGDVYSACTNSVDGDTVNIPSGTFAWGAGSTYVPVERAITLQGAGTNDTIINIAGGSSYGNGAIRISGTAVVKNFQINGTNSGNVSAFSCGTTNGWRISNILFNGGTDEAYFCYVGNVYGLIDNCTIIGNKSTSELVFGRGPTNSWQTTNSLGTTNAVYIENCTFGGSGYVCDANSNARFVVRFCTITGQMKIDGHGKASNTPARGVRHMEVYSNLWTATVSSLWYAIELRGGSGMLFNNYASNGNGLRPSFKLEEYGCTGGPWANFGNVYQTPINYPIDDQIGVGIDPKAAASEPVYEWNNVSTNKDWTNSWTTIPDGAIQTYTNQMGDPSATFTLQDIIGRDRDYFKGTNGVTFTGSGGVGIGTKSEMQAITATTTNVGFWVTDESSWNTTLPANTSGQLYTWNGSAWVLKYTPLTYPHPLAVQSTVARGSANTIRANTMRVFGP